MNAAPRPDAPDLPGHDPRSLPLVDVLVPTFNSAAYIAECLASVMGQTYPNLSIVVVDDASSDATFDLAREVTAHDGRVTVTRNGTNLGNRGNFEHCLRQARAPYVKFVCADDVLEPTAVARLVALAESSPDVTLVTSRRLTVDERGAVLAMPQVPDQVGGTDAVFDGTAAGDLVLTAGQNWIGEPTTVLFRRESLDLDALYRIGSAAPRRNLDIVWWLKIMAGHRMGVVADVLSRFRVHGGQQSSQASLRADLVLSWYDIIVGAIDIGYLRSPIAQSQALATFVQTVQSNVTAFAPADVPRAVATLGRVEARLKELVAA